MVSQKLSHLHIDPALPLQDQLEMRLSVPDLTNTDVLMIKMKHQKEVKIRSRKEEKEIIIKDMRDKKWAKEGPKGTKIGVKYS